MKKFCIVLLLVLFAVVSNAQEEKLYTVTINVKGTDSAAVRQQALENLREKCIDQIYNDLCKRNFVTEELQSEDHQERMAELLAQKTEIVVTNEKWNGKKMTLKGHASLDLFLLGKDVELAFNRPIEGGRAAITFVPAPAEEEVVAEEKVEKRELTDGERQAAQEYFKQAMHAESAKNYVLALDYYKKGVEIDPYSAEPFFKMGNAYSTLEDYDEAIDAYKKALEIKPDYADVLFNLGNAYLDSRDFDNAIEVYQQALSVDATNKDIYYNLGSAYFEKGDQQHAVGALQNAARNGSQEAQLWLQSNRLTW